MRKTILLATAAAAALAMTAFAAPAGAAVYDADTGVPCEELWVEGNSVAGGCLVQNMEGEWTLMHYGYEVTTCDLSFDFQVDEDGRLYAVDQDSSGCSGFQRVPCYQEGSGESLIWPGEPVWVPGVGLKHQIEMCFTHPSQPEGGWETVLFDVSWDEDDYLTGLTQYGSSSPWGFVGESFFDNEDHGEGPEIEAVE